MHASAAAGWHSSVAICNPTPTAGADVGNCQAHSMRCSASVSTRHRSGAAGDRRDDGSRRCCCCRGHAGSPTTSQQRARSTGALWQCSAAAALRRQGTGKALRSHCARLTRAQLDHCAHFERQAVCAAWLHCPAFPEQFATQSARLGSMVKSLARHSAMHESRLVWQAAALTQAAHVLPG